jgi:hypothetical protein
MAIPFAGSAPPKSNGSVFGVPFLFSMERQVYTLPNGMKFDYERFDDMYQYVAEHIKDFDRDFENSASGPKKPKDEGWSGIFDGWVDKTTTSASTSTATTSNITAQEMLFKIEAARKMLDIVGTPVVHKELNKFFDQQREDILNENKKIQLRWDKEFNNKVTTAMRTAIEQGAVVIALSHFKDFSVSPPMDYVETAATYTKRVVIYNGDYKTCRAEIEKIYRDCLPPPRLINNNVSR